MISVFLIIKKDVFKINVLIMPKMIPFMPKSFSYSVKIGKLK